MKLGFHYHVCINRKGDALYCPGYLGRFLDSVASEVEELTLIMHSSESGDDSDYLLKQKNIKLVCLGNKPAAWRRVLFNDSILVKIRAKIGHCDKILVRAPSPLAPFFHKHLKITKLVYLVVGDHHELGKSFKIKSFRSLVVKAFISITNILLERQLKANTVIANNRVIFDRYKASSKSIHMVNTTTLSESDFFVRDNTCNGERIDLLFTGRISFEKGLQELFFAFESLTKDFKNLHLNIVGWEDDLDKPVEKELRRMTETLKISGNVHFHGYKKIGSELNAVYRSSDIYIIPSYIEGFPRTVWEAMANSLPVIATNVGGIPFVLQDNISALLIQPRKSEEIVKSVTRLIKDSNLRKLLIAKGIELSKEITLEKQTKRLIRILEKV